jgi:DNA-binding protein YbaB
MTTQRGPGGVDPSGWLSGTHERLGSLAGSAESDDGLLGAQISTAGLQNITIDPRAMRMPSEDLAEAVVAVVKRAEADLDRQRRELMAELGVGDAIPDLSESMASLERLRSRLDQGQSDVRAVFEEFQRQMGPQSR